jgi:type II secretory pathway pseudopilin PulG
MHQADRRGGAGHGFTLVEMAIIMVILGLILTTALPLMTEGVFRGKAAKARATVRNLKQEIIGYTLANGILPDIAAVENMGGSEDPWGHPVAYWSDPDVTSGTGQPFCNLGAAPGNLRLTEVQSPVVSRNYDDIAFVIASRGPNVNLQVDYDDSGTPVAVTTYPASYDDNSANFDDFDHTTTLGSTGAGEPYDVSGAQEERFDDIVEYVTWGYLYDRLGCGDEESLTPKNSAINFDNVGVDFGLNNENYTANDANAVKVDIFDNKLTLGNDTDDTRACIWYNGENATLGCVKNANGVTVCGQAANGTNWTVLRQVFKFEFMHADNSTSSYDFDGGFVYAIIHANWANATTPNDNNVDLPAPCGGGGGNDGFLGYAADPGAGRIWSPKLGVEVDVFPHVAATAGAPDNMNDPHTTNAAGTNYNHVAAVFYNPASTTSHADDNDHVMAGDGQVSNPPYASDNPRASDGFATNATAYADKGARWMEDLSTHWIRIVLQRSLTPEGPGAHFGLYAYTMRFWLDDSPSGNFLDVGSDSIPNNMTDAPIYEVMTVYLSQEEHEMMDLFRMGWTMALDTNGLSVASDPQTIAISSYGFNQR